MKSFREFFASQEGQGGTTTSTPQYVDRNSDGTCPDGYSKNWIRSDKRSGHWICEKNSGPASTGVIVGGVIGVLILFFAIIYVLFYSEKNNQN